MGDELVSIIIPVYNGEKYIEKCIDSLIKQTWSNLEILIINDGSSDHTVKIIECCCKNDSRIVLYSQQNNGVSAARNKGIDISHGEYIIFCDSDDEIKKNYVEELVKEIKRSNVDIVTCGYIDISKYGQVELNDFFDGKSIINRDEFIKRIFCGVGGTLWGKIFKAEIIKNNNIKMDSDIYVCEDMLFVLEYSIKCKSYGTLNKNLYKYNRLNENSISAKVNLNYYNNLVLVLERTERILKENNFSNELIREILSKRIKLMTKSFLILQHNKIFKYSNSEKKENIKKILSSKYLKEYDLEVDDISYADKLLNFLISKNNIFAVNKYTLFLYNIQNLKDKVKGVS